MEKSELEVDELDSSDSKYFQAESLKHRFSKVIC